jgi:CheY-like chemotaxis protein
MFNNHAYLYVDDDKPSREIMERLIRDVLRVERCFIFEDSADFVERLYSLPIQPDVILLDIHMSPDNGFRLLEILRGLPEYQTAKIVALTASVMNEEVEQLQTAGFDGAISKPLNIRVFPTLLQQIIEGETVWYIA